MKIRSTLARVPIRIPYKLVGMVRACEIHDAVVARVRWEFQVFLRFRVFATTATPHGKTNRYRPRVAGGLERPNANTHFAYEVVQQECERIGVPLPKGHEHEYNAELLKIEEAEYDAASKLLCPSEFVVKTFVDKGFSRDKLLRHIYGHRLRSGALASAPGCTWDQAGVQLRGLSKSVELAPVYRPSRILRFEVESRDALLFAL